MLALLLELPDPEGPKDAEGEEDLDEDEEDDDDEEEEDEEAAGCTALLPDPELEAEPLLELELGDFFPPLSE